MKLWTANEECSASYHSSLSDRTAGVG